VRGPTGFLPWFVFQLMQVACDLQGLGVRNEKHCSASHSCLWSWSSERMWWWNAAPAEAHGDVICLSRGYNARTIGYSHLVDHELDRVHGVG